MKTRWALPVVMLSLLLAGKGVGQTFTLLKKLDASGNGTSAGLVSSGSTLYGTTSYGSTTAGTAFKINTDGAGYGVVYNFTNSPDGAGPSGGLALVGGILYGTTTGGGTAGSGTVFKMSTNGTDYSVLWNFSPVS